MSMQKEAKKGKGVWIILGICLVVAALGILGWILKPSIEYRMTMSKAKGYLEAKEYDQAIEAYEKASKIKVSSNLAEDGLYETYLEWAKKQIDDGEYEEAAKSAKEALYVKKNDKAYDVLYEAKCGLAEQYLKAEKYEKAIKTVRSVLDKDPENEKATEVYQKIQEKMMVDYLTKFPKDQDQKDQNDQKDQKDPPVVTKEKTKLTMWTMIPENDASYRALQYSIQELEGIYSDVEVQVEAFDSYEYRSRLCSAIAAGEEPDIYYCTTGDFLELVVDAGSAVSLNDAYLQYEDQIMKSCVNSVTFRDRVFAIPTAYNAVVMFANMDVLEAVGFDRIPETFDELTTCCVKLKQQGYVPFACGGEEYWTVMEYVETMMIKSVGAENLYDVFMGRSTWNNQQIANAIHVFKRMCELGYIEGQGLYNDEAKNMLLNDEAAFYVNGTWNCADFSLNGDGKIAVGEFPVMYSEYAEMGEMIGGPYRCICVASRSKHRDVATEYAFEFARRMNHYECLDGCGISAFLPYGDESSIDPLFRQAMELCMNAKTLVLYGDSIMSSENASLYYEGYQGVFNDEVTGKEFTYSMSQRLW